MPKGKPHPAELKARVALEVMHGEKTVSEVASEHDLSPNLVRKWVAKAEGDLARVFTVADDLHRKIGELTAERDHLQRGLLKRYGIDIEDVPGRPGKR